MTAPSPTDPPAYLGESGSAREMRSAAPASDLWARVLPPAEGRVWFDRLRPPIRLWRLGATALVFGVPLTLLMVHILSWTYFVSRPGRLAEVVAVGPVLGVMYELAVEPYRAGIAPRGIWLRFLPWRTTFFPWGFVSPEEKLPDGRVQLRMVDPRWLTSETLVLTPGEAQAILQNPWSRDWVFRDEANRRWTLGGK